jgi:hypothetical protein
MHQLQHYLKHSGDPRYSVHHLERCILLSFTALLLGFGIFLHESFGVIAFGLAWAYRRGVL